MDNNRRRKHIKYRPSKAQSGIGVVAGGLFVILGLFVVIPTAGPFGIIWTLFAVAITGMSIYQLTGHYIGPEITIEEEGSEESDRLAAPPPPPAPLDETEARLQKLQKLHDQCLISDGEYEEKRKEILKDL